jgi:hypothetical protein
MYQSNLVQIGTMTSRLGPRKASSQKLKCLISRNNKTKVI